jgi:hypothetical protein
MVVQADQAVHRLMEAPAVQLLHPVKAMQAQAHPSHLDHRVVAVALAQPDQT